MYSCHVLLIPRMRERDGERNREKDEALVRSLDLPKIFGNIWDVFYFIECPTFWFTHHMIVHRYTYVGSMFHRFKQKFSVKFKFFYKIKVFRIRLREILDM